MVLAWCGYLTRVSMSVGTWRNTLFFCAMAALMPVGQTTVAGVVFRYLPGSMELSSPMHPHRVEAGPFLDPHERPARWPGGWGYEPAWAAEFEGESSTLWGGPVEDLNQPAGPRLTAEVWLRLFESDTHQTLLSNRIGSLGGFTLGLDSHIPYFAVSIGGITYRIKGTQEVLTGQDVWIAATAEYTFSNILTLSIYRDGKLEAEESIPAALTTPYVISRPFFVGTEATGPEDAPNLKGTITGLLYAAVVRDYVAHPLYLTTVPPFDGSTYFGLPAFHDYGLEGFDLPMDQRIDAYATPIVQKFFLPHVNDAFIPQGTAVLSNAAGRAELVYVSYYHRTRTNRLETRRSIVVEIDAIRGRVRRTFRLNGLLATAHVGGVALVGEALYVASEGILERYPVPKYAPGDGKYVDLMPDAGGTKRVLSKASFVSSFEDTLWVGDYRTASQQQPYLYGYGLDDAGLILSGAAPVIYPIPRRIQGVDFHVAGGTVYVFMARNRNSREAEVLRFKRADLRPGAIFPWEASITFPHGIEDLAFAEDGTLWTNSESGTDYYQRTARWSTFYPFVYGVNVSDLLVSVSGPPVTPPMSSEMDVQVFPNPAADQLEITYVLAKRSPVRIQIFDLLGRRAMDAIYPMQQPGNSRVTMGVKDLAAGTYFVVIDAGGRRGRQSIVRVR